MNNFYPRPPRGGRRKRKDWATRMELISIHALREEGDRRRCRKKTDQRYFYPRPPRGGRRRGQQARGVTKVFLSTPSARRATKELYLTGTSTDISIHALREEGDVASPMLAPLMVISIHALREEGDTRKRACSKTERNFYPRPPRGGRPNRGT